MENLFKFASLLDWEPIPGYPIKIFDWILAVYIISIAALVVVAFYFLVIFLPKRQNLWKKIRLPIILVMSIGVVLSSIAAPVLSIAWEPLMQALNKDVGGASNDSENARLAIGNAKENVVTLEKEGIVLLKNHDNVLPLNKAENNKINVFGSSAFGMLYGGGGSGVFVTNATVNGNDFHATRLEKALLDEGFEYNMDLYNLVANYYDHVENPSKPEYTIKDTNYDITCQNNVYAGNAKSANTGECIIDPTRFPYDNEPEVAAYNQTYDGLNGKTLLESAKAYSNTALYCISRAGSEDGDLNLKLTQLTDREKAMLQFLGENFEKVIFLVNSSNPIELGLASDNEKIDSILWVGHPGLTGTKAIAKTLSGEYNPSGKMADTWVYDNTDHPSAASFGPDTTIYCSSMGQHIVEYKEGIYVGYRYFTTRAFTDPSYIYDEHVIYSFGEGYSYTTYEKRITDYTFNAENNSLHVQVEVKNTGTVAGKEVVQLYLTAPYTPGGIEKAYVELAGFAKTEEIKPGESFYAGIDIDLELLASWDTTAGNYVLEKGEYEITLRENAWQIADGTNGKTNSIKLNYAKEVRFLKGRGGGEYSNKFEEAEAGPTGQGFTVLSRNNWEGTYPKVADVKADSSSATARISAESYTKDNLLEGNTDINVPAGITLRDMKDAEWDDPRWESFISQMSKEELINLVDNGGFKTVKVESISKRETYDDDGPASIQVKGTGYVGEVVIAASWNVEAARLMGESIGREGAAMALTGWYAPGLNMHRCPTGGRNFEYYSEDPILAGHMAGYAAKGTAKYGVYTYCKHIALNEQETTRQNLTCWANEQTIRQIYLRAFEVYTYDGGLGFMSSFSRIGTKWSGEHGFLNTVCRDEWGFHGVVITDWINPSLMPVNAGLRGGNDLWLYKNSANGATKCYNETKHDGIILLKRAAKNILYACAHSNCTWTDEEYQELGVDFDWSKSGMENY